MTDINKSQQCGENEIQLVPSSTSIILTDCNDDESINSLKNTIQEKEGIIGLQFSPNGLHQELTIQYYPSKTGIRSILEQINTMGYHYERKQDNFNERSIHETEKLKVKRLLIISAVLSFPLLLIMIFMIIEPNSHIMMKEIVENVTYIALIQWILATPVQFYIGKRFYKGAWGSLSHGAANMDVLVALATSISYFYSAFVVIYGYFEKDYTGKLISFFLHT